MTDNTMLDWGNVGIQSDMGWTNDTPEALLTDSSLVLSLGERRLFTGTFPNGNQVQCFATLRDGGQLTRIHKTFREPDDRDPYWVANYTISGMLYTLEIIHPQTGQMVTIEELITSLFNQKRQNKASVEWMTEWLKRKTGISLGTRQTFFGMLMGADEKKIDAAVATILAMGRAMAPVNDQEASLDAFLSNPLMG